MDACPYHVPAGVGEPANVGLNSLPVGSSKNKMEQNDCRGWVVDKRSRGRSSWYPIIVVSLSVLPARGACKPHQNQQYAFDGLRLGAFWPSLPSGAFLPPSLPARSSSTPDRAVIVKNWLKFSSVLHHDLLLRLVLAYQRHFGDGGIAPHNNLMNYITCVCKTQIESLFGAIDLVHCGCISINEFVAACLAKRQIQDGHIKAAFERLDLGM